VKAVDTSVVVPALLSWHDHHDACRAAATGASIPAHALLESFSVMTRLPTPHRIGGQVAHRLLEAWFDRAAVLPAPADVQRRIVPLVSSRGFEGGSVCDALIGLTARSAGHVLVTRDRRALRLYEDLDVEVEFLAP
jgi:predicted nucleic acid-binding protein